MSLPDLITRQLEDLRAQHGANEHGDVATYIPELSRVDPDLFGIAVASRGGAVYTAGDADFLFTIQSVSKPFVYGMALAELGMEAVLERVGAEPSGEAFNAISLEPGTGRPANPMINAGAIVTTSLIPAASATERFSRISEMLSAFAGRQLDVDEAVYRSEQETGDTNRALAYLMRSMGALQADVDEALDVYFRQCAVLVTARDIAVMAATLANGGINPHTGESVVSDAVASQVLTVMATCGMYDASGEWLLRVGLPAKSGVSGAVVAASPGQFGIGIFSPRLDARGNSVRAIATCRELSDRFDLHLMRQPNRPMPSLLPDRTDAGAAILRRLHGDLSFSDAESLLRSLDPLLDTRRPTPAALVIDATGVRSSSRAATAILAALGPRLTEAGVTVLVAGEPSLVPTARALPSLDDAHRWLAETQPDEAT
jgi:glutaminase